MKGKFLKYKNNYYRRINHLMNRINLELKIEKENKQNELDIKNKMKAKIPPK